MKVLIAGDSFSSIESTFTPWFDYIWKRRSIINIARPGAGNTFICNSVDNTIKTRKDEIGKIYIFYSSFYRYDEVIESKKKFYNELKKNKNLLYGHDGKSLYFFTGGPNNRHYFHLFKKEYPYKTIDELEKFKKSSIQRFLKTNQICLDKFGKDNFKFGFSIEPDQDVYDLVKDHPCFIKPVMQVYGKSIDGLIKGMGYPHDGHFNKKGHEKFAEYLKNYNG